MRFGLRLLFLLACGAYSACDSSSTSNDPAPTPDAGVAPAPPLPALAMNDVSILVPIPSSPAAPGFLRPSSAGERGRLLPQAVYDKIPEFPVVPAEGLDYARMRVIGIRFDGCFPAPAEGGCQAQIRLVMQPITDNGETKDSALHLFYRLTTEEITAVVTALREMKALAPEVKDGPVDVHPALLAQGFEGAYGAALRELVLTYAGEQNLIRMTFFLRAPPQQEEWFFGGFDRNGATMTPLDIVGVGKGVNQRVDRPETAEGYEYAFTPAPKKPEDVQILLVTATAKTAPAADLQKAIGALARIENPMKYGPDQLDCAGCHVATTLGAHAKANLALDSSAHADAFTSSRDLTVRGKSGSTPSSLRAFGWFKKDPMIAKRVVHETAAVLDDLEARFPRTAQSK